METPRVVAVGILKWGVIYYFREILVLLEHLEHLVPLVLKDSQAVLETKVLQEAW